MNRTTFRVCALIAGALLPIFAQQAVASPQLDDHAMNRRGDHVMGFDHDKTTHHFTLTKSGGVIQVQANSETDTASRDHIRMHLQHIAKAFAVGDFTDPHDVHAETPPGVPAMRERKDKITYTYESTANGGKVLIRTDDAEALAAVHSYLQYQIREHKTGDSTDTK